MLILRKHSYKYVSALHISMALQELITCNRKFCLRNIRMAPQV